jgi:uncharacterized GH25 family protein
MGAPRRPTGRWTIGPILAGLMCAAPVRGHDFWIQPATFHPQVDHIVPVRLRIGHLLRGVPVARDRSRFERFVLAAPEGEFTVLGRDGVDPAGLVRARRPGVHVIGYHSKATFIELEAVKFEAYLRDNGLDTAATFRGARGRNASPGRERFSRCAKAILSAGEGADDGFAYVFGFPLEIVPENNPLLRSDEPVVFRLLYDHHPCPDALVTALPYDRPILAQQARSDDAGRVRFRVERPGVWLIKVVHMVRAGGGSDADWESYWASLTFERPGLTAKQARPRRAAGVSHATDSAVVGAAVGN